MNALICMKVYAGVDACVHAGGREREGGREALQLSD